MKRIRFWAAAGRTLAVVTLTLIVVLMLVPGSWAAEYKALHKFKGGKDGASPQAGLIFDPAGNLYGTTYAGGRSSLCDGGCGTVFKLTSNGGGSWTKSVLHSFHYTDGSAPSASLILDAAGNLYGTTAGGGIYGMGTVFQLTPNGHVGWTESVIHSFVYNFADGYTPEAALIFDQAGNLYGTTRNGGTGCSGGHEGGCGTVFQLTPNGDGSWTENIIHSFTNDCPGGVCDGLNPLAGLIVDAAGNLYGTTPIGGDADWGTVFELKPNGEGTWAESILHSFMNIDGDPQAGLIFDAAGNLYGTSAEGGSYNHGTVFKLIPNPDGSWTENVLHSFTGGKDGDGPCAGLILDGAGNLYGTTLNGGTNNSGTVFKLILQPGGSWKFTTLHRFKYGQEPQAVLVMDAAGNLYGTAPKGGRGYGVVFRITP